MTPEKRELLQIARSTLHDPWSIGSDHARKMAQYIMDTLTRPEAQGDDYYRDLSEQARAASDKLDRAGYYDEATLVIQLLQFAERELSVKREGFESQAEQYFKELGMRNSYGPWEPPYVRHFAQWLDHRAAVSKERT